MKTLKAYLKKYFIDAMGAMALGLFASLLIGTIFSTLGKYTGVELFSEINKFASASSGMAIGVAIAYSMKAHPLVIFSSATVGYAAYSLGTVIGETTVTAGPAGSFVAVIVAVEIGMLVSKKTRVDILVTPTVTILSGVLVAKLVCPGIAYAMYYLGEFVNTATTYQPLLMGIVIAVVVGIVLTLPISSAALCAMISIGGIAGGAAAVGCCCQMVGFAACSFRENKWGGVVSQGLGTSMLQMGNICRNPRIWIAPTLASAICGPLSTMIFKLECTGVSAGMGTCGLVGPIGIVSATGTEAMTWIGIALLCIVLPAVLSIVFTEIFRKIGWIREGDMKLEG
ncbi:MAG: PTS sugar transporter subunit IIC [Clostridia bacterium]|nr:PTS sugar transporter subunit IIC [Clostridia bacterium]